MKELREEIAMKKHLKMKVAGSRMRWQDMCKEWVKTDCQKEHGKQKRVAEEEEEDQSCDGKAVSNEIWKGQVQTAKSGRPPQKTEGNGEH